MVDLGQIFTKNDIANYMVSLFELSENSDIMDPCFGTGAFLNALSQYNYSNVTACEIDTKLFETTKNKYQQYTLLNSDFLKYNSNKKYDGIIMNPPYIRHEKINDLKNFGITKEFLRQIPIFANLPGAANMYMYFIIKAIDLLKENGQLIVIFPNSWINTKNGLEFEKIIFSKCGLDKQIHIYGEAFEKEALVDVFIWKLIKGKFDLQTKEVFFESKDGKLVPISINKNKTIDLFSYPFSEFASVKRGLTTGCNKMYINPDISCEDESYCIPIISSPKSIKGYSTINAHLDKLLFLTDNLKSVEVTKYLDSWKKKIIVEQKPKTLYSKATNNKKWYELHEIDGDGILFSYFVRNDMKFVMNDVGVCVRDNFYIIKPTINKWVLFALLNNYYTYYQLELFGKRYGAGLLKLQRYDIEALKFPEYRSISVDDKTKLECLGRKLANTGDPTYVSEITKTIAKYSTIDYDNIKERYFSIKTSRLEVN